MMIPVKNTITLYTIGLNNSNANKWEINTNNLKRLSNLGNALTFNNRGEYKLNYKNRKKLLNALIVLEKIKKKPSHLTRNIKNQRNKINEIRNRMVRNFKNKRAARKIQTAYKNLFRPTLKNAKLGNRLIESKMARRILIRRLANI